MGDLNYEYQFVGSLLQDEVTIRRAQRAKIEPRHITDEGCRYIYTKCLELHQEGSEINTATLTDTVKHDPMLDTKDKKVYIKMVKDLGQRDLDGVKFSVNFLRKKRKNIDTKRALQQGLEIFVQTKDADEAVEFLHPQLDKILRDVQADVTEYTDKDNWQKRKAERIKIVSDSTYGLKFTQNLCFLSKYFPRGLESATITSIGGNTGVGKSLMLNNITYVGIHPENGLNGLYIIAENKKIQTESRLDSIVLDKRYDELFPEHGLFEDAKAEELFENMDEGWGQLYTVKLTVGKFDANDIDGIIEDLADDGIDINFLVIDSPDHMKPIQWMQRTHERKGQVYIELKALCDKYEIPIITSLPMTASSAKQSKVQAEDSAGSYDIARICDAQIFFYKSAQDELLGRRQIEVVKNRDWVVDGKKIPMKLRNTLRFELWEDDKVGAEESEEYKEYKIKRREDHKKDVMDKFKKGNDATKEIEE